MIKQKSLFKDQAIKEFIIWNGLLYWQLLLYLVDYFTPYLILPVTLKTNKQYICWVNISKIL